MSLSSFNRLKWIILSGILYTLPILLLAGEAFARAGGGGSGGGGSGKGSWLSFLLVVIISPFLMVYYTYVQKRLRKKEQRVSEILKEMAKIEPQWAEEKLLAIAHEKFVFLQTVWGKQDLETLKQNLCPALYADWETQIKAQQARDETNILSGLSIISFKIIDVQNHLNDQLDTFTVRFEAFANDQTFRGEKLIKEDRSSFTEFWTFSRDTDQWKLKEITQESGWSRFVRSGTLFERRPSITE